MTINFNYTLDSELHVNVGQVPTAISVQALTLAAREMSRKFMEIQSMITRTVPGTGGTPFQGMVPAWQQRITAETIWVGDLLSRIVGVAEQIALEDAGDAIAQGSMRELWNRWAPAALSVYSETLKAFNKDVGFAMTNRPVVGIPPAYAKMANLLKEDPPSLSPVAQAGFGSYTGDDAAYLAEGLGLSVFGRHIPDGLIAVGGVAAIAGWYFFGRGALGGWGGD